MHPSILLNGCRGRMGAAIAAAEKIKVEEQDLNSWLMNEAMRSGQRPDKFAKELGKDIALEIHGAETELDKSIVEKLNDPLVHLIRN